MLDNLKKILSEAFDIDCSSVNEDTILADIGIDSLAALELSLEIETEYNIFIEDEDLNDLVTISDVINMINSKLESLQ